MKKSKSYIYNLLVLFNDFQERIGLIGGLIGFYPGLIMMLTDRRKLKLD